MPCPANELGVIEPFVAMENSKAHIDSALWDGWRAVACGAFGHGMSCPYWGKSENEERGRGCAKHLRLRYVLLAAQAEAYAT